MAIDKAVDSTILDNYFADIADAIRDKDGTENEYTPAQMPQAIEDIPARNEELMALLEGRGSGDMVVRGVTTLRASSIQFSPNEHDNGLVTSLEFPDLVTAQNSIGALNCGFLSYPSANRLKTLKLPVCEELYFNNSTFSAYGSSFTTLETIEAPVLSSLSGNLRNSKVSKFEFPILTSFQCECVNCTSLRYADLGHITTIGGQNAFNGCTSLETLVLRGDRVVSLNTTNKLSNTLIASGTGYIYVPRDLISTYQAATNWVTYASQFRALEDYTVDGTIDGDLDPTKI